MYLRNLQLYRFILDTGQCDEFIDFTEICVFLFVIRFKAVFMVEKML